VESLYGRDGQLLYQRDARTSRRRQYVYLAGSLVAEHDRPLSGSTVTVTYQHTDVLGSPVATTDAARAVLQRSEYEPYGKLLNRPLEDGPAYTGHVSDAATSLVYMQQRYYDPRTARFWSVDPVTVDSAGGNFNRYWYANDNPFKFVDPDGRYTCTASASQCDAAANAIRDLSKAVKKSIANKIERRYAIAAIKRFYGKEGQKNGVVIQAASSPTSAGAADTKNGITTISINFDGIANLPGVGQGTEMYQSIVSASIVHEGSHGFSQRMMVQNNQNPLLRSREAKLNSERNAYRAEGIFWRGLGERDPYGFWTGSGFDEQAIEDSAQGSVNISCSSGGCLP
jgi:RHS repeat-associated protein